jgi:glycosyltransferase involved in cell wall biosynthesis
VKICLFITVAGPMHGGLQVLSVRLAQHLKKQGNDVRIIGRFKDAQVDYARVAPPEVFTVEGVEVEIVSIRGWRRLLLTLAASLRHRPRTFPMAVALYQAAFRPAIDRASEGADIVHFFGVGVEMTSYAVLASARHRKIPFVVQPAMHVGRSGHGHGDWPLYHAADMIIAHTEFEAETLRQGGVKPSHVRTVLLGFDPVEPGNGPRFRKAHGIEGPMILFIGRRFEDKGYFLVLEAFALLRHQIPNATLVIAGSGDWPKSTAEGVLELGLVSDETKQDALGACTIFCVPSKGESFGIAYFEAWNCGKPVVALDLPTLRETVGASGGGLLAKPDDAVDLAEKLRQLLGQPELAVAMGTRGREFSRSYSWSATAQCTLEAYAQAQLNQRLTH